MWWLAFLLGSLPILCVYSTILISLFTRSCAPSLAFFIFVSVACFLCGVSALPAAGAAETERSAVWISALLVYAASASSVLAFSVVGSLLAHTVLYPPLLDSLYAWKSPFFFLKTVFILAAYHLLVGGLLLAWWQQDRGNIHLGWELFYLLLAFLLHAVWSFTAYWILVRASPPIRWHHSRSVHTILFYATLLPHSVLLLQWVARRALAPSFFFSLSAAGTASVATQKTVLWLWLVDVLLALLFGSLVLVLRCTRMRNRRISDILLFYASDKQAECVQRRWFGISCDHVSSSSSVPLPSLAGEPETTSHEFISLSQKSVREAKQPPRSPAHPPQTTMRLRTPTLHSVSAARPVSPTASPSSHKKQPPEQAAATFRAPSATTKSALFEANMDRYMEVKSRYNSPTQHRAPQSFPAAAAAATPAASSRAAAKNRENILIHGLDVEPNFPKMGKAVATAVSGQGAAGRRKYGMNLLAESPWQEREMGGHYQHLAWQPVDPDTSEECGTTT
jgi:hypothetical protein